MKFLHTADWQIGMSAKSAGPKSGEAREERFRAAARVVEAAREQEAEFMLVAGDTFEDNAVSRELVQRIADTLARFGGPVYIIPGNHDPACPGSVWNHPAWKMSPTIHVLTEPAPLPLPGGVLYPCPLTEKYSTRNPTAWIPRQENEGIRIGLAHGTVEGIQQTEPDYPIPRDSAEKAGLDYLALGHWHSTAWYEDSAGFRRMAYSGTHETTKFGERDSGNVLCVEIDAPGAAPRLTPIRTGGLRWETIEFEFREPGDLKRLLDLMEGHEQPERILLSLRLSGTLHAQDQAALAHTGDMLKTRYFLGEMDASALRPAPDDDTWIESLPGELIRETARHLRDQAASAADERQARCAARALIELYTWAEQEQP